MRRTDGRAEHLALRAPVTWYYGHPLRIAGGGYVEVRRDLDVQPGPNKLMRRLTIEDGEVVEVETLGYGCRKPPAASP